jgi:hypothetical protein
MEEPHLRHEKELLRIAKSISEGIHKYDQGGCEVHIPRPHHPSLLALLSLLQIDEDYHEETLDCIDSRKVY